MIRIFRKSEGKTKATETLMLPFDTRKKSRIRAFLESGEEVALMLERGNILRGGDLLEAEDGRVVEVVASPETVMKVTANSHKELMAAAYHLGNRHVSLQIGEDWLLLERDHVLKEMLCGLGVNVVDAIAPYEPEAGAYGGGHRHGDDDAPPIRPPSRVLRNAR